MRILIVEDELEWRNSIKLALKPPKYEITIAENYIEAQRLLEFNYDLMIIDLQLSKKPHYEGELLLADMIERGIQTPCIILTQAFSIITDLLKSYSNVVDIIVKGEINLVRFREIVNRYNRPEVAESYVDFDLHISPTGHTIANSNLEGQATCDISTTVPTNIQVAVELIEKRAANAEILKDFGQALYHWLFPEPIHTHFHQTEAVARDKKTKIRLRLRVEAEEIASLPLEFIYRSLGGYFLAVNPNTVLSRYLNLPLPPVQIRRREGPLHMLTIIADPSDQARLPPDEWETIIKDALAIPLRNGQMTIETVKHATRKAIRNALLRKKPDIIQFVGHGIYQGGKGFLALVDETTNKTWLVDDERFASLYLGYDDNLGLISLATCESAKSDDPQGFLGIAPQMIQRGVPAVLSMQYKVYIETAKVFLEDFYTSIAARKPIDWATQSARNAISQEFGLDNREFATPVLYMRSSNGQLF